MPEQLPKGRVRHDVAGPVTRPLQRGGTSGFVAIQVRRRELHVAVRGVEHPHVERFTGELVTRGDARGA